jgi:hypothetical protein
MKTRADHPRLARLRRTRWAALGLLPLLLVTGASAGRATHAPGPRTLVAARSAIYAFAQDGNQIAWIAADARVRVHKLSTRTTSVVGRVADRERARGSVLALAGNRVLWAWDSGGNSNETSIVTGAPGRRSAGVATLNGGFRGFGDGERFSGLAGDGATLAFGWADEACADQPYGVCDLCEPLGSCPLSVVGGGIAPVPVQVSRQRPPVIPGITPPVLFAVAEGRVAVVPACSPTPQGQWVPRVAEDGPVEVFDISGRLLMRVRLFGIVRDVALTGHKLAVLLEQPDGSKTILRYDARNGTYLGGSGLLPLGAKDLSTGTGGLVFRVGRLVYALRGRTATLVARAATVPIGLSIEGRRIAWAENVRGRGRVRTLTVSG